MTKTEHILIVDDEPSVVEVVSLYLKRDGFEVSEAADGEQALTIIDRETPNLVILDIMLPKVDGLSVVRQVRTRTDIPIILLTARSEEMDRVVGLEIGADDYVVKPFSPRELVSRVRAVLRRTQRVQTSSMETEADRPISQGALLLDPRTRDVTMREESCVLTAKEFDLLWFLLRHPRQVFNREQLLENVWGVTDYVDPSTITVHMRRLREKIEADPGKPEYLHTMWGVGYRFEAPHE